MRAPITLMTQLASVLATSTQSSLPRYQALYEALRQQILDGLLLPGMCLPSSRVMSDALGFSRNTVITAIEQLCVEGYAQARAKSGVYILSTVPVRWENQRAIVTKHQPTISTRGHAILKESRIPPTRGAFVPGIPDIHHFPFTLWQRYLTRHTRNAPADLFFNQTQGGDLGLRQALADYLRLARGVCCEARHIIITHGTQYSLQLVADLLANPQEVVWMEEPGYAGARAAFTAAHLNIMYQSVDQEGLACATNAWRQPPKLIYTTPSHQYPTGVVMSAARRRDLLAHAAEHHCLIIEDDYDSEFRYETKPLAALHALAPNQVIYLGTLNKIFFPGLHIGYMVLPDALADDFRKAQVRLHKEPSYIVQKALADFFRDGHASSYIRKMRSEYQAKRDVLVALLQKNLGDIVQLGGLETGLHLVVYLSKKMNDQVIAAKAQEQGIVVAALSNYYMHTKPVRSGLILGFGNASVPQIKRAGKVLCEIILI